MSEGAVGPRASPRRRPSPSSASGSAAADHGSAGTDSDDDGISGTQRSRPGAYRVPGRAFGQYPAWGSGSGSLRSSDGGSSLRSSGGGLLGSPGGSATGLGVAPEEARMSNEENDDDGGGEADVDSDDDDGNDGNDDGYVSPYVSIDSTCTLLDGVPAHDRRGHHRGHHRDDARGRPDVNTEQDDADGDGMGERSDSLPDFVIADPQQQQQGDLGDGAGARSVEAGASTAAAALADDDEQDDDSDDEEGGSMAWTLDPLDLRDEAQQQRRDAHPGADEGAAGHDVIVVDEDDSSVHVVRHSILVRDDGGGGRSDNVAPDGSSFGGSARVRLVGPAGPVVEGVALPCSARGAAGRDDGRSAGAASVSSARGGDIRKQPCWRRRCLSFHLCYREYRPGPALILATVSLAIVALCAVGVGVGIPIAKGLRASSSQSDDGSPAAHGDGAADSDGSAGGSYSDRYVALREALYPDAPSPTDGSPQSRALEWMADVDPATLDPTRDGLDRVRQRFSLAALHYATGGAGGSWVRGCGFLSGGHECGWNDAGVAGDGDGGDSVPCGAFCDGGSEVVTAVDLRSNNLNGTLPGEIGWLSNLTKLQLVMNRLSGTIPGSIGDLTKMRILDLTYNNLVGTVPPEMNRLSDVKVLLLTGNGLTGTIPPLRNLSNVRDLSISANSMTGTIPAWLGDLRSLQVLALHTNTLTGTIPSTIARLSELQQLYLFQNDFDGGFPPIRPGDFPQLRALVAWNCDLTGTVPDGIGHLTGLVQLSFAGNRLTGTLPELALRNLTELQSLDVLNNDLTGTIPTGIGGGSSDSSALGVVSLGGNRLEGPIPDSLLSENPRLKFLSLSGNLLTGTVPSGFRGMEELWLLDLRSNRLGGSIPASLGNMTELRYLDLSDNRLVGTVPDSFSLLDKLDWFSISRNELTGDISFLCSERENVQFYADCAGPAPPEVHCPCCMICCRDDVDCDHALPILTLQRNLCFQHLIETGFLEKRSENYLDLICTPDSILEQIRRNDRNEE